MSFLNKAGTIRIIEFILLFALIVLLVTLFQTPIRDISYICWNDDDYSHGLMIPFIILYIWWDQKDIIIKRLQSRSLHSEFNLLIPLLMLFCGLTLLLLGLASQLSYFSWISFFLVIPSSVWLIFGKTPFMIFTPPFLLLVMAKPLPDSVVVRIFWPLQVLAAKISANTLELFNVPVYLSGNIIELPGVRLMVEEACSGMRSVMALLTLSFIMNFFIPLNYIGKVLLVIFSLLLAIGMNIFRVAITGILAHFYDRDAATGFFHTFSGLLVFIVGLPLIFMAASFLSNLSFLKKGDSHRE